ncbi:adipocyte plasma membrane-associated protein-like isoform X2 [Halichondria panicea]|uniref:adipocyte plasma membrane-associated protein-like isoform X2 n=1 Tax=Halichondria panicea TaxID=6063 RepID=UPI00312B30FE
MDMDKIKRRKPLISSSIKSTDLQEVKSDYKSFCCCANCMILHILAVLVLLFILPAPIEPRPFHFSTEDCPIFSGCLSVNDRLKKSERLFENEIVGPEALTLDNEGSVYTGLADGRLIRLSKDLSSFYNVTWTGNHRQVDCGSEKTENQCGRPLGMQFHHRLKHLLYIADSSIGLVSYNTKTTELKVLLRSGSEVSGSPIIFLNDLVVLRNDTIIISQSSCKYTRAENRYEVLEGKANGRLLYYNLLDDSYGVLLDELYFSNGICLSFDESSVLVVETTRARIFKYHLMGNHAGETEMFVDNLPGLPDNISPSSTGGYWVGIAAVRTSALEFMARTPIFRKFLSKWLFMVTLLEMVLPQHSMILELSANGTIVQSLHDYGGDVTRATSHVLDLGDKLLIGSYSAPFLLNLQL